MSEDINPARIELDIALVGLVLQPREYGAADGSRTRSQGYLLGGSGAVTLLF